MNGSWSSARTTIIAAYLATVGHVAQGQSQQATSLANDPQQVLQELVRLDRLLLSQFTAKIISREYYHVRQREKGKVTRHVTIVRQGETWLLDRYAQFDPLWYIPPREKYAEGYDIEGNMRRSRTTRQTTLCLPDFFGSLSCFDYLWVAPTHHVVKHLETKPYRTLHKVGSSGTFPQAMMKEYILGLGRGYSYWITRITAVTPLPEENMALIIGEVGPESEWQWALKADLSARLLVREARLSCPDWVSMTVRTSGRQETSAVPVAKAGAVTEFRGGVPTLVNQFACTSFAPAASQELIEFWRDRMVTNPPIPRKDNDLRHRVRRSYDIE